MLGLDLLEPQAETRHTQCIASAMQLSALPGQTEQPFTCANSRSRVSWPGTAIMAPLP